MDIIIRIVRIYEKSYLQINEIKINTCPPTPTKKKKPHKKNLSYSLRNVLIKEYLRGLLSQFFFFLTLITYYEMEDRFSFFGQQNICLFFFLIASKIM